MEMGNSKRGFLAQASFAFRLLTRKREQREREKKSKRVKIIPTFALDPCDGDAFFSPVLNQTLITKPSSFERESRKMGNWRFSAASAISFLAFLSVCAWVMAELTFFTPSWLHGIHAMLNCGRRKENQLLSNPLIMQSEEL